MTQNSCETLPGMQKTYGLTLAAAVYFGVCIVLTGDGAARVARGGSVMRAIHAKLGR